MADDTKTIRSNPTIVELVGLAGAGKTTLAQHLVARDDTIRIAPDLELRKARGLRAFAGQAPFLLSEYLSHDGRPFTWDETKSLVYLRTWPHILRRQTQFGETIVLLDHGPIFKLATLHGFGPERVRHPPAGSWWDQTVAQWAATLDMVVWLYAAEETLTDRINGRHQRHVVKGKPRLKAIEFLMRYQMSYDNVMADLAAHGGPVRLDFDTNRTSVARIADIVFGACNADSTIFQES